MEEETTHNDYYEIKEEEIFSQPIDYMSIDIDDFSKSLSVTKEDIIHIPDDKHLSDMIMDKLYPRTSETVVINSSVGQGKSHLAVEIAKRYATSDGYKGKYAVIFVAPHKSLVNQYTSKLYSSFQGRVPNYERLIEVPYDSSPNAVNPKNAKSINNINYNKTLNLHVVTIDCLLGNAGKAIEQSGIKRKYIDNIISYTEQIGGRVIIIFDEIHDAIDIFQRQDLVHRLWSFKTGATLFKTFVLSATFSVAAKTVIEYIAELTNSKLRIIETQRKQYKEDKLSNLHLHITTEKSYKKLDSPEFIELFDKILSTHTYVDVLSSSALLASTIVNNDSDIRKLFDKYIKRINLCISSSNYWGFNKKECEPINLTSGYQADYCNIGTMFKTGISIEHEGSALVIILPNKYSIDKGRLDNSSLGIFSNGIIDVIQAIARVRKKSDIYVIMPTPTQLIAPMTQEFSPGYYNYLSLMPRLSIIEDARDKTMSIIDDRQNKPFSENSYDEIFLRFQKSIIKEKHDSFLKRREQEISAIKEADRTNLPKLEYSTLDEYILKEGDRLLSSYYAIFGKDLPAYMIWAAFNNQFVNCTLKTISSPKQAELTITIEPNDTIQDIFLNIFMKHVYEDESLIQTYDYQIYTEFKDEILIKKYRERLKDIIAIRESNNKLHRHIMSFIQKSLKGNNRLNEKYHKEEHEQIQDIPFEAEDYLLCCIANANLYTGEETIGEPESYNILIDAYNKLGKIRQLYIDQLVMLNTQDNNRPYIYPNINKYGAFPFNTEQISEIVSTINTIQENDKCFKYFEKLQKIDFNNTAKAFISAYKLLKSTFFQVIKAEQKEPTDIAMTNGYTGKNRPNIDYIEVIELPTKRTGINLLYKYDYIREENYEDNILDQMNIDEYNMPDWNDDLEKIPMTTLELDESGKLVVKKEDSNQEEQHNDSTGIRIQEPTTEEHKPDEPDKSKIIDEWEEANNRPISENDLKISDEVKKIIEELNKDNSQEEES